jgi:hypothetical protein
MFPYILSTKRELNGIRKEEKKYERNRRSMTLSLIMSDSLYDSSK